MNSASKPAANRKMFIHVQALTCWGAGGFNFVPELRESETVNTLSWHVSDEYALRVEFELPTQ
jgi:hypothetical protein